MSQNFLSSSLQSRDITLFLCGDVMTGRGVDQTLPHSIHPHLFEPYLSNAREYVMFAEKHGEKHYYLPMDYDYIWGDALEELSRLQPDLRIINLETEVATSERHQPDNAIHYRELK
ncbi:MAG: CapA family protein [Pseudomonadota bacterium]|nr:CapA family protein [Pseudomonadota bacterium]